MSGLLFLTSDDFKVIKGNKGNFLSNSIQGLSLILFYSTQCVHCQKLISPFKKLPGTIGGCQFGMINVSTNKQCVIMSNDTMSAIEYVPTIILFNDGNAFMRYNGPHDVNEIRRFVMEVANKIRSKQKFTNENIKESKKRILEYYDKKYFKNNPEICYLKINDLR